MTGLLNMKSIAATGLSLAMLSLVSAQPASAAKTFYVDGSCPTGYAEVRSAGKLNSYNTYATTTKPGREFSPISSGRTEGDFYIPDHKGSYIHCEFTVSKGDKVVCPSTCGLENPDVKKWTRK